MTVTARTAIGAMLAGLVLIVFLISRGGDDAYTVKAVYDDAGGLTENYDVKVDGVPAGSVKRVELGEGDKAVLTLEIDKGAAPIGEGATAIARPVNLLGEKYVDLDLGDRSRPQPSGSTIPPERTGAPVELDDVLNTLDAGTRARLRILINESGVALAGRGADFNSILRVMPKALDETRRVVEEMNEENVRLRSAITAGDRIMASFNDRRSDLQRIVVSASEALNTVAERRADLGATVEAAPGALRQLSTTLGELDGTAQGLIPASRALRSAAGPLEETLASLPAFTDRTRATLKRAVKVAPSLSRLGRQAAPDVRRVTRTVTRLNTFAKDIAPLVRGLERGVLRDAIGLMDGWSRLIQRSDGLGHIFRVRFHIDQEIFTSALTRLSGDAPPIERRTKRATRKVGPSAPVEAPSAPTPDAPAAAKPKVPLPVLGDVVETLQGTVDEVLAPLQGALEKTLPGGLDKALSGGSRAETDQDMLQLLDYLLGS
jgi:virulence factor Mce-like protein